MAGRLNEVLVFDSHGRPVPAASVSHMSDDVRRSAGITNDEGRLALGVLGPFRAGDAIVARKPGYAPAERFVDPDAVATVTLTLEASGKLVGSVRGAPDALTDASSIHVVAVPKQLALAPPMSGWQNLLLDPRVLVGRCRSDGRRTSPAPSPAAPSTRARRCGQY